MIYKAEVFGKVLMSDDEVFERYWCVQFAVKNI